MAEESEQREAADRGSWIVDVGTGAVTCSAALLAVVGIRRPPGGMLRIGDLFVHATESDRLRVAQSLQNAVLISGTMNEDVCLHIDDTTRWVRVRGKVSTGHAGRVLGTCQDVTEEKRRERQATDGTARDPLTGLPNRAQFTERLSEAIAAVEGDAVGILFIDLDRFADVNDRFGEAAGDALLARMATRLTRVVRPGDVVARFGGDEFVVLCAGLHDDDSLPRVARRVLHAVAVPAPIGDQHLRITASIGLVQIDDAGADPATALREADAAMYEAKQGGRDRVESFDRAARTRRAAQRKVSDELAAAIEHGELELWFQPMVSLDTWQPVSVEALVRWRHPEHGVLSAGEFIPVAEGDGSIVPLGAWIMEEACRYAARTGMPVAVNVSARQLADESFTVMVRNALEDVHLDAAQLCIEVTETVLVEDIERSTTVLSRLRSLGVRVAIDDFGVGYSSLSYIRRLPIDIVKIDRSFIAELGDPGCDAIVAGIANVSRALGFTVVAEGVEARKQLISLRALRVDVAQGFLLSWPLTYDELQEWDPLAWRADAPSDQVDMRELLGRRAEAYRRETGRSILVQAPEMAPLSVDPETVTTVMDELLNNALAFSASDLPVVIRCSSDRRWVRVSVADYGIGMTKHDAERCWEQFFQGSRPPVTGVRGTGIGLYVVRSLIEGLGGFTNVKTSSKGGSTFTFALPRRARPDAPGVGEPSSIQEFMKHVGVPSRGER